MLIAPERQGTAQTLTVIIIIISSDLEMIVCCVAKLHISLSLKISTKDFLMDANYFGLVVMDR